MYINTAGVRSKTEQITIYIYIGFKDRQEGTKVNFPLKQLHAFSKMTNKQSLVYFSSRSPQGFDHDFSSKVTCHGK